MTQLRAGDATIRYRQNIIFTWYVRFRHCCTVGGVCVYLYVCVWGPLMQPRIQTVFHGPHTFPSRWKISRRFRYSHCKESPATVMLIHGVFSCFVCSDTCLTRPAEKVLINAFNDQQINGLKFLSTMNYQQIRRS